MRSLVLLLSYLPTPSSLRSSVSPIHRRRSQEAAPPLPVEALLPLPLGEGEEEEHQQLLLVLLLVLAEGFASSSCCEEEEEEVAEAFRQPPLGATRPFCRLSLR